MTTVYQLPLSPQTQKMRVDIGGTLYTLRLRWNPISACWIVDLTDENDAPLINGSGAGLGLTGIPLVTGTDLMGQFRYLGIGGGTPWTAMTIGPGHSPDEVPTRDNLGTDGNVYFETLA